MDETGSDDIIGVFCKFNQLDLLILRWREILCRGPGNITYQFFQLRIRLEVSVVRLVKNDDRRCNVRYPFRVEDGTVAVYNDGSFTIPSTVWNAPWQTGDQITMVIGRVRPGGDPLSHNNAENGMVGIHWVIGAGFSQ